VLSTAESKPSGTEVTNPFTTQSREISNIKIYSTSAMVVESGIFGVGKERVFKAFFV